MHTNTPNDRELAHRINNTLAVQCMNEELLLHPERVIYWSKRKTLLLADSHLGKEFVFQRAGLALPAGTTDTDLDRLKKVVALFQPEHVVILGDMVHALPDTRESWIDHLSDFLQQWLGGNRHRRFTVVKGNHDKAGVADILPGSINWVDSLNLDPFQLQHEPAVTPGNSKTRKESGDYVLCGHLHPGFSLSEKHGDHLRMPVFWFANRQAVLPAFGSFTGLHMIQRQRGDRVFGVGPDVVMDLRATGSVKTT